MARPREFDEKTVLGAVMECFWSRGYEGTSVKDLSEKTGITIASLYNAFGDKHALFRLAFDQYVENSIGERIRRCRAYPPYKAIVMFFQEIVTRSLNDREHKGCMLVNSALELAPHDAEFRKLVSNALGKIEDFFRISIEAGQQNGTITTAVSAEDLARHLLGVLMGIRVLARARPERGLLEGIAEPALHLLRPPRS